MYFKKKPTPSFCTANDHPSLLCGSLHSCVFAQWTVAGFRLDAPVKWRLSDSGWAWLKRQVLPLMLTACLPVSLCHLSITAGGDLCRLNSPPLLPLPTFPPTWIRFDAFHESKQCVLSVGKSSRARSPGDKKVNFRLFSNLQSVKDITASVCSHRNDIWCKLWRYGPHVRFFYDLLSEPNPYTCY